MYEDESAADEVREPDAVSTAAPRRARRVAEIATRVDAEQIRLLFDLGETSRYTIFGAILVVGLSFYATAPLWTVGVALVIQIIAQISFDRVRAGFRADPEASERALIWARRYAAVTFVSGMTWGVGGLLWLPGASFAHYIFYALVIYALAMATAITRATYPPAAIVYTATVATPTLVLLVLSREPLALATAALGGLSLATVAGWSRQINRSYREAIRLRFENADLVERMARAHAATEQKRQDAEAAERSARGANRAKNEFLAILGHEVRTPIDGIARMAKLLREEPLSDTQTGLAHSIEESSLMLARLFDDMLDFSQMEAQALELKPQNFNPVEIARSAVRLMRPQAVERGLSLELDLVPQTPDYMVTDPDRLRQVLLNLLSNAIKFTETGGVILRLQRVPLGGDRAGIRFSVLDTGIGLTPDARARIFEGFSPGTVATGEDGPGGIGLGLAISDRLVRLMGGRLHVDSAPGQGSTFWFLIAQEPGMETIMLDPADLEPSAALTRPERLIDHDFLYELEREVGQMAIIDRMVEALEHILDLQRRIETAQQDVDAASLADSAAALKMAAAEIGFAAVSSVAGEIGEALDRGLTERALRDVPRLQQKISASRQALGQAFPHLDR